MLTTKLKDSEREPLATGQLVIVHADDSRKGGAPAINHRFRRFIVESFPLGRPLGHCANLRALDNGQRFTVSGFWLEVLS